MALRKLAGGRYPWMSQKVPRVKPSVNLAQRLRTSVIKC